VTVDHRPEYLKRVNRVIDYIEEHLASDPSLPELLRLPA